MNKHTPGPWNYTLTGQITKPRGSFGSDPIAHVHEGEFGEFKANVHLIAAAPDMADALKAARSFCGNVAVLLRDPDAEAADADALEVVAESVLDTINAALARAGIEES